MNAFRLSQLPPLPGVSKLSETEIQYDLEELLKNEESNATDSDSSIRSEDVLPSQYPVKPRKGLLPIDSKDFDSFNDFHGGKEINNAEVNEALQFVKQITSSNRELHDAEQQREELESMCKSYELSSANALKDFHQSKGEQEMYLRVMQALTLRSARVYSGRIRQTIAYNHILDELISKRKDNEDIEHAIQQFRALPSSKLSVNISANSFLPKDVTLFVGQVVETPLGNGKIVYLDIEKKQVQLQLFDDVNSIKIATFYEVAQWRVLPDSSALTVLIDRWDSELKHAISMKTEDSRRINELLLNQVDESEGTDNDISSDLSCDEENNDSDEDILDEKKSLPDASAMDTKDGENNMHERAQPNSLHFESETGNDFFPLVAKLPAKMSRQSVLDELLYEKQRTFDLNQCAVSIAPIASLATATTEHWKPTTKHFEQGPNSIILDPHSLDSDTLPPFPLGTTGSLAWNGDIGSLQEKLKETVDHKNKLEHERFVLARKIESMRSECVNISTEIAALRLSMFTRRITHRNYLGSQGIIIHTAPVVHVPVRSVPKSNQALSKAFIGDAKLTDALKTEEKVVSRSSRSKTKGSEEVETIQPPDETENAAPAAAKRSSSRNSEATAGRSNRTKEELKSAEAPAKRGRAAPAEEDEPKDEDDANDDADDTNTSGAIKKKPKRRRY